MGSSDVNVNRGFAFWHSTCIIDVYFYRHRCVSDTLGKLPLDLIIEWHWLINHQVLKWHRLLYEASGKHLIWNRFLIFILRCLVKRTFFPWHIQLIQPYVVVKVHNFPNKSSTFISLVHFYFASLHRLKLINKVNGRKGDLQWATTTRCVPHGCTCLELKSVLKRTFTACQPTPTPFPVTVEWKSHESTVFFFSW